jgi:hypothetical protein
MVTVRHDVLIELGYLERSIHVLRILGANSLHESAEHAIQIIHGDLIADYGLRIAN